MGSPGEQGQMVSICDDCACAFFLIFTIVFELIEMKLHSFIGSTWSARTTWLCWTKWPTRRCYTLICVLFVSVNCYFLVALGKEERLPRARSQCLSFSHPGGELAPCSSNEVEATAQGAVETSSTAVDLFAQFLLLIVAFGDL